MGYTVRPVENRRELNDFIRVPYALYENDPMWVPPLLVEEKRKYSAKHNPMLHHCDYQLFVLYRNGKAVGRISAFVDHLAVAHWKKKIGLFGAYECIDDGAASRLLLDTARQWLQEKGMTHIRGSWSFASQEFGTLVKGFDSPPMVMAPYNPPYHDEHFLGFGLKKAKDLMVYKLTDRGEATYELPERFSKLADRIVKKYGVSIRPLNMKRLEDDVMMILEVANASTRDNWGYVPVTDEEARDIVKSMKPIVDPDIVMIAEIDGKAVGYMITFPNANVILKGLRGRLLPTGIFKLFFGMKKIRQYRVWGLGIIPEYQRRAIDTLFYQRLYEALKAKKAERVEINYVLEDNMAMNNPIFKMGFVEAKKYRVYEMKIG